MVFGLTFNWELEETMPEIASARDHWWSIFSFVSNACIFVINACSMATYLREIEQSMYTSAWFIVYPVVLYLYLLAVRLVVTMIFLVPFTTIGIALSWRDAVVMSFGWLKGDMALTLAYIFLDDTVMQAVFSRPEILLVKIIR